MSDQNEYNALNSLIEDIFTQHFREAVVSSTDDKVDIDEAIDKTTKASRAKIQELTDEAYAMNEEKKAKIKAEIRDILKEELANLREDLSGFNDELRAAEQAKEKKEATVDDTATDKPEAKSGNKQNAWGRTVDWVMFRRGRIATGVIAVLAVVGGGTMIYRKRHEAAVKLDETGLTPEGTQATEVVDEADVVLSQAA